MSNRTGAPSGEGDLSSPRRWGRIVDVVEGGVLYTEDAERLVLAGVGWPANDQLRAAAENRLSALVADKIVFYNEVETDRLGRLLAEVWVDGRSVNKAMREVV